MIQQTSQYGRIARGTARPRAVAGGGGGGGADPGFAAISGLLYTVEPARSLAAGNLLFQDSAGTTPGAVGLPVGKAVSPSNAAVVSQATAGSRPTYADLGGGKGALAFDGANDWLLATAIGASFGAYFLVKLAGDCCILGSTSQNNQMRYNGSMLLYDGGQSHGSATYTATTGQWLVVGLDRTGSVISWWENTTARGTNNTGATLSMDAIGGLPAFGALFANGQFAGAAVYNRPLIDAERAAVVAALLSLV